MKNIYKSLVNNKIDIFKTEIKDILNKKLQHRRDLIKQDVANSYLKDK